MRVTIFTTNTCAYCAMVKKFLDYKQIVYDVINLDDHPERQQELYDLTGTLTVPITIFDDEAHQQKRAVVGYNLPKLAEALAA